MGGQRDKKQSWVKTWPRINVADVCVLGEGGPTVRREKARRASRRHYGKAETVIHCSKKDEIARGRDGRTRGRRLKMVFRDGL